MSFPLECEPAKITFVGRPLDPNKGFTSLLDALELLLDLPEVPQFHFWIIGGEPDEGTLISKLFDARPRLNQLVVQGKVNAWGRVKREALPEFYKRSSLVIMPSHREPFGLVAIESMLCGCPVIGTKQGGLSDTIIHGITGVQADVDSPKAIANAILLYLRNPQIRKTRGMFARNWAKSAFTKSAVYDQVRRLYCQDSVPSLENPKWELSRRYSKSSIQEAIIKTEELLEVSVKEYQIIASRYHIVAKVETTAGTFALKQFKERPCLRESVFPLGKVGTFSLVAEFIENTEFHSQIQNSPALIATDKNIGIAIYEWLETCPAGHDELAVRSIIDKMQQAGSEWLNEQDVVLYATAVDRFLATLHLEDLFQVDEMSFRINRFTEKPHLGIRETHPMVELQRILMCSELKGWVIDKDVLYRLRMVIRMALKLGTPNPKSVQFCHGDLKARHILKSDEQIFALDTERSVFAVGSLDLGIWAGKRIVHGMSSFDAINSIKRISRSEEETITALQWLVYSLVFGYLIRVHHGDMEKPTKMIMRILYDLSLTL